MSAYQELIDELGEGEEVEFIIFGAWGWGHSPECREHEDCKQNVDLALQCSSGAWELAYGEPNPPPVPFDMRGVLLTLENAKPYMLTWKFSGGYGSPDCYATYIWTNFRVLFVSQYDGSTRLISAPRNPIRIIPEMPGG